MQLEKPAEVYAGFWLRFVAWIIDGFVLLLLNLPVAIVCCIAIAGLKGSDEEVGTKALADMSIAYLASLFIWLMYFTIFECTKRASVGKICMGIEVTDQDG